MEIKRTLTLLILLVSLTLLNSCEKAQEALDDGLSNMLGVRVFTSFEQFGNTIGTIKDVIMDGKILTNIEQQLELPQSVPYSFVVTSTSTINYTSSTSTYTGSVPKSMFNEKSIANTVSVVVKNGILNMLVNNVSVKPAPAKVTGGGGGDTGGGSGSGSTGAATEIKRIRVEGNKGGKSVISFNLPKNAKTLTIKTTELTGADLNMADIFVSRGTVPTVTSPYPYVYSAQYKEIAGNRGTKEIKISNAQAGDWNILLYGFNSSYWSWVIVTAQY